MNFNSKQIKYRIKLLELYYGANAGHIGCSLSCIDILIALFQIKTQDERVILSKGHAAAAMYTILNFSGENFFNLFKAQLVERVRRVHVHREAVEANFEFERTLVEHFDARFDFLRLDFPRGVGEIGRFVLQRGKTGAGAAARHLDFGSGRLGHIHLGPLLGEDDEGVRPLHGDGARLGRGKHRERQGAGGQFAKQVVHGVGIHALHSFAQK